MNIFHLSSEVKLEQLRHHDGYEHAMFYLGKRNEATVKIRHPDSRRDPAGIAVVYGHASGDRML